MPAAISRWFRGDLPVVPGRRGGEWVPGADVEHMELGRGWVVRRVAAADSSSGLDEVAVRFEVAKNSSGNGASPSATPT